MEDLFFSGSVLKFFMFGCEGNLTSNDFNNYVNINIFFKSSLFLLYKVNHMIIPFTILSSLSKFDI